MRRCALALFATLLLLSVASCGRSADPLVFSPTQLPEAQSQQAYQVTIVVSGNHTPVEQIGIGTGTLPPGLTLARDGNSASISGTPQEVGRFEFTVGASCLGTNETGQTGEQVYVLVVK
jgi:predicted small lipoprotein YifL